MQTKYEEVEQQVCEICEEEKPASEYFRGAPLKTWPKGKLLKWCKACHSEKDKIYRGNRTKEEKRELQARRQTYKRDQLLASFGLRRGDVPKRCEICKEPPSGGYTRLAVDHDHRTGLFRGFLCSMCNLALGNARDDPKILRKMARYLTKHAKETEVS